MPQPPMLQPQTPLPSVMKHSQTDLGDLKSQLAKRLGQERAQRYFSYLNGFLSQKLSKREFNKFCILTLGHQNLSLHNLLIRSILQNACQAKASPPIDHNKFAQTSTGILLKKSPHVDDGLAFLQAPTLVPETWSNGDILPQKPCKFRSGIDSLRIKDRSSPLGPNGRAEAAACQPSTSYVEAVLGENGDLKRSLQQLQGAPHEQPAKRARIEETSLHDKSSLDSKVLAEAVSLHLRENLDHRGGLDSFRGRLQAPLGIPFCSASVGGARRSLLSSGSTTSDSFCRSYDCSELYHTEVLKKRMEKMAEAQGLEGVSMDCANLLNIGLDSYLKQLIRSCVELVGLRTGHVSIKQAIPNLLPHAQPINGVSVGNNMQVQGIVGSLEGTHVLSMQAFKVAMELKPQQLGDDWPLLLEKICVSSFKE